MRKKIIVSGVLILGIILLATGVSYAFFNYMREGTRENSVKLGSITFKYTENELGSGIAITDGFPTSDEEGKISQEGGNFFDFKIESNLSRSDLEYEIVVSTIEGSTIPLDAIKLYLTEVDGNTEKEIEFSYNENGSVKTLNDYQDTLIKEKTGKTIYQETIPRNTKGYIKNFRVRMWIREDIEWIEEEITGNIKGSFRIDVYANSNKSMAATDTTNPIDVGLERVVANQKYLFTKVESEEYQYTVTVPNEVDAVEIEAVTRNMGAIAEVSKLERTFDLPVGESYFRIHVTSSNKEKTKEYIARIVREPSGNKDLSDLIVTGYPLDKPYSKEENNYKVTVPYGVKEVEVIGTKSEDVQKIEIVGANDLTVGENIVTVKVIAENGETREITITVERLKSTDTSIRNIEIRGQELIKVDETTYRVTVPYSIDNIEINNISQTGAQVEGTGNKKLEVGENSFTVTVTSQDKEHVTTYTIIITREKDTDNNLTSLELSNCSLTPEFNSGKTSYSCTVENEVEKIVINANANSKEAKIQGLGEKNLTVGNNLFKIEVTAQNGEKKTYEIVVTRKANHDATLKGLSVSSGTLSPKFSSSTTLYTLSVGYNVTSITVTGEANYSKAIVEGNGAKNLNVGSNTIEIKVTAEDKTEQTYTIMVTREKDTDNTLASLGLTDCTLTPAFSSGVTSYSCVVENNVETTEVSANSTSKEAKVSGTGTKNLSVGDNRIEVVVEAQDQSVNTYAIMVHRKSNDATLSEFSITGQTISPAFNSGTTSYTLTVPNVTSSITVNAAVNHNKASISGTGTKSLAEGNNTIQVKVTAEDGTTKTYTITVKRMRQDVITFNAKSTSYTGNAIGSNTASATSGSSITYTYYSGTSCSGGALSGAPTNVGNYSVRAVSQGNSDYEPGSKCVTHTITKGTPTISLTPKSVEATGSAIGSNTASAKNPNGSTVNLGYTYTYYSGTSCSGGALSGAPSTVGEYSVKVVSAETSNLNSGSTCVTHTITRNSNANLSSLSVTGYSLSPGFSAGTYSYTLTSAIEANNITINAQSASGLATVVGTGSKNLSWGSNEFNITVTAQNGTVNVYKITINNQRPTAPTITGGSNSWISVAPTISVSKAGTAISGIKHYEYYKSSSNTAPSDGTGASGTTLDNLTVTDEGTTYIWYRTVSNDGNTSAWAGPQVTNLDTTVPIVTIRDNGSKLVADVTPNNTPSGYTYKWFEIPEYKYDFSSIPATNMIEDGETYYNFKFTKTDGSIDTWWYITFPIYQFIPGNTYTIHFKYRMNSIYNTAIDFRHSSIGNHYEREMGLFADNTTDGWIEHSFTKIIPAQTEQSGIIYDSAPRFEVWTGNLIIIDTLRSADFDIKNVWIEEVENSSNAIVDNNLAQKLSSISLTQQITTSNGKRYILTVTTGAGIHSDSNVIIK